jgi:hypothetical protein
LKQYPIMLTRIIFKMRAHFVYEVNEGGDSNLKINTL